MHVGTSHTQTETQVRLHGNLMAMSGRLFCPEAAGIPCYGKDSHQTLFATALQILYLLPFLLRLVAQHPHGPHPTAPPTSLKPKQLLTSCSSLYDKLEWKINWPFRPQTHNTVMWYKTMRATSSSAHFSPIPQIPPTVELPGPAFQPNMLTYQQGEDPTIQNCPCVWCSEVQGTQAGPPTWYPIGQHDPRHFSVSSLYDDNTIPTAELIVSSLERTPLPHI